MTRFSSIKRRAVKAVTGAFVAIAVTVVGGIIIYEYTKSRPKLQLIINPPNEEFRGNRVRQIITLRNRGSVMGTGISFLIESMKWRIDEKDIRGTPPLIEPCVEQYTDRDDLYLLCGNLQPNAIITIFMIYKRPVLTNNEIKAFADNSAIEKINLDDQPGITLFVDRLFVDR